jgi:membrane protease YdiL (CAAX protease family)
MDIARSLLLVAVLTAWNQASDYLWDRFGLEGTSFFSRGRLLLMTTGMVVSFGIVVWLGCVVWGRRSLRDLGWRFSPLVPLVLVGLLQTAVVIGMVFAAYALLVGANGVRGLAHAIASMPASDRVFYAQAGIKIAFIEETLFRGDLRLAIERRFGAVSAIVVSSVVFALFHRTLAPAPLVMKFLTGVVLALAATRMRSLLPSAMAHALMWSIVANN